MTTITHISDTIQTSELREKHDTTVDRLDIWIRAIAQELDVDFSWINYVGSEFWNSFQTWAQAIAYLQEQSFLETQVLLVNNASRAKHKNSQESKWSHCLWCEVEINGTTHHIVGVDDETFSIFIPYLKKGTEIQTVKWVHYKDIHIDDLSKGTQFRSKEHFPLVQLLFLQNLQANNGVINIEALNDIFTLSPAQIRETLAFYHERLSEILWIEGLINDFEQSVQELVDNTRGRLPKIIEGGWVYPEYQKKYLHGFEGIELIQKAGEKKLLAEKLWIDYKAPVDSEESHVSLIYTTLRQVLQANQICLIDRDKFWNTIWATPHDINKVEDYQAALWYCSDEEIDVYDSNGEVLFSAFVTKTISDKTGKNCIWNSSSRGPQGENLLNINKSIDADGSILDAVQTLPIGTIVELQRKVCSIDTQQVA